MTSRITREPVSAWASRGLGLLVLMGLLFTGLPAFAQATPKIGYVDLQRALHEVDEGKAAKAKLQTEFAAKQKQLDAKQADLMKLKEQLESQGMMLSEDAKRQKGAEFQQKMYELQQLYMTLQQELAQKEAQETQKIFRRMATIIEAIAKEGKYTLVLERNEGVLYAADGSDLTPELIKRFNAKK